MLKVKDNQGTSTIRFLDGHDDTFVSSVYQEDDQDFVNFALGDEQPCSIDRDTMRELLPFLQRFVETGTISSPRLKDEPLPG